MALSAETRTTKDAISRPTSFKPPRILDIVAGLLAISGIVFMLTSQPPAVDDDGISQVVVESQVETKTVHVELPDGSYSTQQSSETTVATTTKE